MAIHETVSGDGVAELVMDNPKVNALNIGDTYHLAEILDGYKRNLDVRVVILTATGRVQGPDRALSATGRAEEPAGGRTLRV